MSYTYKLYEDGYDLYSDGDLYMIQREPYAKIFIPDGTYEENAIAQIDSIENPPPPIPPEPYVPTEMESLRSDVDYMAVMLDVELPSYDREV